MSLISYAVLKCGDEWKVVSGRRKIGHFTDEEAAVHAASRLCQEATDAGHQVELLAHRFWGELVPIAKSGFGLSLEPSARA